eukprot:CAMPEP_0181442878 /NCGR_PEP_ID=MMETSP1110-20121109/24258_1 /TAXON_ID=174948 /ORGANISM="Symbiodinium sp., Strain CCMP421" /LENGTH=138 /DNA_ID=CAMNT_0023566823 /DNA_START=331 /DNA_END=751 /DNA_ORIENTATION=-
MAAPGALGHHLQLGIGLRQPAASAIKLPVHVVSLLRRLLGFLRDAQADLSELVHFAGEPFGQLLVLQLELLLLGGGIGYGCGLALRVHDIAPAKARPKKQSSVVDTVSSLRLQGGLATDIFDIFESSSSETIMVPVMQ